jgi:ankyrin repeat protein
LRHAGIRFDFVALSNPERDMNSPTCFLRRGAQRYVATVALGLLSFAVPTLVRAAEPALLQAVRSGDEASWRPLLAANSDVKITDAAGNTALHLAALNHDVTAVTALLAAGAEADALNHASATPLIYGAGEPEIVAALLRHGANSNAAAKNKTTPLTAAVTHPSSYEVVQRLIEAGAEVRGDALLRRAVMGGDRRTLDLILARGAAGNPKTAAAALSLAANRGDTTAVQRLLEHGADQNLPDDFVGHALNFALVGEELELARLLIAKGADLQHRSTGGHGTPPMVFAAYNQTGDASVAKELVAHGADVNNANDQGATALSYALRSGEQTPLVEFLRSVGAKSPEPVRLKRTPDRPVPPTPEARAALVRERLPATIKLLQRSSDAFVANGFVRKSNCTSCHGQDLPAVVYGLARERGFAIDDISLGRQLAAQISRWGPGAEQARQMGQPVPGSPVGLAYGLFGLHGARYAADDMTDAMTRYLLRTQRPDGNWVGFGRRPPMEDGNIVATSWVTLSIRDYPPRGLERATIEARTRAARWLAEQEPVTHNDVVFQLLGLYWSGAPQAQQQEFAAKLARQQRPDGGWSQLAKIESDAWATGSALYALHEAGGMPTTDAVYQQGVAFLLRTQFEDGSWWVRSRSWPFQPHFNSQFPHGKDLWISQGGTAWAAMALLFALEPTKSSAPMRTAQELIAGYAQSPDARRQKASVAAAAPLEAKVSFAQHIRPILERSCVGCHDEKKPRGGLAMISRDSLLKGGQSGEPSIVPGYAEDSPLIHFVSGKIEDLEMPPLARREKYPALSAAEIELLHAWIDAGAPWPADEVIKTDQ